MILSREREVENANDFPGLYVEFYLNRQPWSSDSKYLLYFQ